MIKKVRYVFILLLIVLVNMLYPTSVSRKILPDLIRPRYMDIDKNYIYITTNNVKAFCYSLNNKENDLKINIRKGQGPGEYHCPPMIKVLENKIKIETTTKIGFYTKEGKYIDEIKKKKFASRAYYLKNNRLKILRFYSKKKKSFVWAYDLYNKNQKKIRRLCSIKTISNNEASKYYKPEGKKFVRYLVAPYERHQKYIYNNKLFLLFAEDNIIKMVIYDHNGKLIRKLDNFNILRRKITEENRQRILQKHAEIIDYRNGKGYYKIYKKQNMLKFPEYFPRFSRFFVDNDKIYIMTNMTNNSKKKTLIYDISGKKLGEQFLPSHAMPNLTLLKNGNYYFIDFSDEEEEWFFNTVKLEY